MMNIWVARNTCLYSNETYLSTHITEKGALIAAIKTVRGDLFRDDWDEDELEDMRPGMPRDPEEDLKDMTREQLRGIIEDWWEYSFEMNEHGQYEIHQTQAAA